MQIDRFGSCWFLLLDDSMFVNESKCIEQLFRDVPNVQGAEFDSFLYIKSENKRPQDG